MLFGVLTIIGKAVFVMLVVITMISIIRIPGKIDRLTKKLDDFNNIYAFANDITLKREMEKDHES